MLEIKQCPRCRGDLHTSGDIYGEYKECLQCGYMADVAVRRSTPKQVAAGSKRKVA